MVGERKFYENDIKIMSLKSLKKLFAKRSIDTFCTRPKPEDPQGAEAARQHPRTRPAADEKSLFEECRGCTFLIQISIHKDCIENVQIQFYFAKL